MVEASHVDPFVTAGQVRDIIDLDVSDKLVHQRFREAGLKNQNAAQKPLLSADVKVKGIAFAQAYDH